MNILSLFDGISCGMIALERAGIKVDTYYASEIEPLALSISKKNYPGIVQLGDVTKWREWDIDWKAIDLLIGGSPCQGFSSSGKELNFNDPRSKLFFEFSDILNHIKKHNANIKFMLENVKMKNEWSNVISHYLGVDYVEINSRYFSAQNRVRYYWANFEINPYKDKGIILEDIIEDDYIHSAAQRTRPIASENHRKSLCLEVHGIEKSMCLVTVNLNNLLSPLPKGKYIDVKQNSYPFRVMTPTEMERLQTVPNGYVGDIGSNKAAKVLGNGWTVDVIAHILSTISRSDNSKCT
ncbi:MAG: DNA cytosine methyltransferase [Oscillospiraceae bacterium]